MALLPVSLTQQRRLKTAVAALSENNYSARLCASVERSPNVCVKVMQFNSARSKAVSLFLFYFSALCKHDALHVFSFMIPNGFQRDCSSFLAKYHKIHQHTVRRLTMFFFNCFSYEAIEVNAKKKRPLCLCFMCNKVCFFSRIKTVLSSFLKHSLHSRPLSEAAISRGRWKSRGEDLALETRPTRKHLPEGKLHFSGGLLQVAIAA